MVESRYKKYKKSYKEYQEKNKEKVKRMIFEIAGKTYIFNKQREVLT